jgi:CRP-like cAMP-binding protein
MAFQKQVEALRATQLFRTIPAETLKPLASHAVERRLHAGEILFIAGEEARGLYLIISGSLRAFRESEEGREQTIHIERAGATLAEVPVFDGGSYPSTVMAEEDTVVFFLAKEDVRRFLLSNPEAALAALGILAARLRKVASLVEHLTLQDVAQLLAAMLIEEAKRSNGSIEDGTSFSLPDPHHKIAARLGSVREVITRNLRRLVDEGLISIRGHRITILDAAALRVRAKMELKKLSPVRNKR